MAVTVIVEDGTGLTTATSYIDLDYMRNYWANNGYTYASTMTLDQELQLINRSALFLDGYRKNWGGYPVNSNQAMQFPRSELYDKYGYYVTGVPEEIKKAQCIMAYYMDSTSTASIASVEDVNGKIKSYTDKVGSVQESREYFEGSSNSGSFSRIAEIDAVLKRFSTAKYGAVVPGRVGGSDLGCYSFRR